MMLRRRRTLILLLLLLALGWSVTIRLPALHTTAPPKPTQAPPSPSPTNFAVDPGIRIRPTSSALTQQPEHASATSQPETKISSSSPSSDSPSPTQRATTATPQHHQVASGESVTMSSKQAEGNERQDGDDFSKKELEAAVQHYWNLIADELRKNNVPGGKPSNAKMMSYNNAIALSRRSFQAARVTLENSTVPTIPEICKSNLIMTKRRKETSETTKRDGFNKKKNNKGTQHIRHRILYAVLTGRTSHKHRVRGIHHTLGAMRKVVWFSDSDDALIRPRVLNSSFEDSVCSEGSSLVAETQMKGCRYQRNFYRALMLYNELHTVVRQLEGEEESERIDWIVKISDDTLVIPQHLESVLGKLEEQQQQRQQQDGVDDGTDARIILGKNETRQTYWFLSGGHPTIMSRAAFDEWHKTHLQRCEGYVIDHGGAKRKKFWWWADDVLLSFCWMWSKRFRVLDLPGAISSNTFSQLLLPSRLWEKVAAPGVNSSTSSKEKEKEKEPSFMLPVSYHTYPYVTPKQMYGLYNRLMLNQQCEAERR